MSIVGLLACSSSEPTPRSTASIVVATDPVDCTNELPDCDTTQLAIADVRRDGDRVGVLVLAPGRRQVHLYLSDDLGSTWRHGASGGDLVSQYIWAGGRLQLALHAGQAWLLLQTAEAAGGGTAARMRFAKFDLDTRTLGPLLLDFFLGVGPAEIDANGRVTVAYDSSDIRGGPPIRSLQAASLSPLALDTHHQLCAGGACGDTRWVSPDRGHEWQAVGVMATTALPGEACRFLYRYTGMLGQTSPYGELHCVPYAQWPSGLRSGTQRQQWEIFPAAGGELYVAYETAGESFARTIVDGPTGGLTEPIVLGPGKQGYTNGFSGRSRYAGLAAIVRPARNGAAQTLVRLRNGAAEELDVPPYPCDAPCGDAATRSDYGALHWLEPLDDDGYLAFWLIDEDPSSIHKEILYAERVRGSVGTIRTDAIPIDPGPAVSPIPGYPNAFEATGLIGACARAELCGLGEFEACLLDFATNSHVTPASRENGRLAMIAASENGCSALAALVRPAGCTNACLAAGATCDGTGCGFAPADPEFCDGRVVGTYCNAGRVIECDSNSGETVRADCTNAGTACVDPAPSGSPGAARCEAQGCTPDALCVGNVQTSCISYRHCEDFAQTCSMTSSTTSQCRSESVPEDARCRWGMDRPICAGDYVLHCLGDRRHYTKCSDLGFAGGCQQTTAGATCAP